MCNWLLQNAHNYQPDTIDLNKDLAAAAYWFPCMRELIQKFAQQAKSSQSAEDSTAEERAEQFLQAYMQKLAQYEQKCAENESAPTVLGLRELLELIDVQLRQFGFPDPWRQQKQLENCAALNQLPQRLEHLDAIASQPARWTELVRGVIAGNMFDAGARAVTAILEKELDFGLYEALQRIEQRPWLIDDLDAFLSRLGEQQPHKCAAIFVDNSGADIVLGILPFARELLLRGTKVMLCANSAPSLNDITAKELSALLESCPCLVLTEAWAQQRLMVYENGQRGPCLDVRNLPQSLCEAMLSHGTDLLVIEGMGRAVHTNFYAKFNCETLKLAVIKNQWLAERMGGNVFSTICKYETIR